MRDLRHSANLLWACVFCGYICNMLSSCLFKTHPPNDCILSSWSTYFCNQSVFSVWCPRSFSCLMWRLLQCSDTFRFLADCPRDAPEGFGLVVAIPALLFLACLHIEFARVYLHVFRTHLQLCRHLLRSVFSRFKQPMVSSPRSERKTRKCSCEAKNRTAARGRCLGLKPPLSQTMMKARIGHPWRDQTRSCSPSRSILARSVLLQFLLHFAIASRNNKPTKHQGHHCTGSRAHALWRQQRRLSIALHVPVCLTPNRRAQNR